MPMYEVRWIIDIEASSPQEAAEKALEIQRDSMSIATSFDVINTEGGRGDAINIDLLDEPSRSSSD